MQKRTGQKSASTSGKSEQKLLPPNPPPETPEVTSWAQRVLQRSGQNASATNSVVGGEPAFSEVIIRARSPSPDAQGIRSYTATSVLARAHGESCARSAHEPDELFHYNP